MHRIGKKYILQAIPDSAIARTFLYLLRHLRFTLPSTNLLIQTKFFYFLYFNLLLQHTIQIKEKDRYMCFHSCRWNPETKTAVSTEGKYKPKLIWANSSPCKFSINCDQRLRLSTFWWLLRANSWQDIHSLYTNKYTSSYMTTADFKWVWEKNPKFERKNYHYVIHPMKKRD